MGARSEDRDTSDDILEKLTKGQTKQQQVQVDEDTVQIIIINLDNAFYALPAERIFEIGERKKIFSVPGTPTYVLGVQNLRGDIASILSLQVLLQLPTEDPGEGKRIIYSMMEDNIIGYLVETVEDVIDFPISGIKKTLVTLDRLKKDFIQGEIAYKEQHIPLLNLNKIYEKALQGMNSLSSSGA